MPSNQTNQQAPSSQLLAVLADYPDFLIVTHDNPDPDAIATDWAIRELIEQNLGKPADLVGGGGMVRAENRRMLELLNPPIRLAASADVVPDTATILVDCTIGNTNQLLTRQDVPPVAVVDHHWTQPGPVPVQFEDIRPDAIASASIAASYLREQDISPGSKLATALLYAMRTEACGQEFDYSPLDRSILLWLTSRAEPALRADIENAPLNPEYFGGLRLAIWPERGKLVQYGLSRCPGRASRELEGLPCNYVVGVTTPVRGFV